MRGRRSSAHREKVLRWLLAEKTAERDELVTSHAAAADQLLANCETIHRLNTEVAALERAERKWRTTAMGANAATDTPTSTATLVLPDGQQWSAPALLVLLEEYQTAHAIAVTVRRLRNDITQAATTAEGMRMFVPQFELAGALLDHVLHTAQTQTKESPRP